MADVATAPEGHPSSDLVASALGRTWALLASTLQVGWARESDGVHTLVTGVPIPAMNGVWAVCSHPSEARVQAGLDAVASDRVPFCLQVRPSARDGAAKIASARHMVAQPDLPVMATGGAIVAPSVDELNIRVLAGREAPLHCEVAGSAFDAPPELFAEIITAEVCDLSEVRIYLGEIAGEPVVTAVSITVGDAVGIFSVATIGRHRRRGYGAALTARAVNDAIDDGAAWAWLQSSDAGYNVYERLGFVTIERWPCWISSD